MLSCYSKLLFFLFLAKCLNEDMFVCVKTFETIEMANRQSFESKIDIFIFTKVT